MTVGTGHYYIVSDEQILKGEPIVKGNAQRRSGDCETLADGTLAGGDTDVNFLT